MESSIFCITLGLLMAFGFILIGVVVGELRERTSDRHSDLDPDVVDLNRERDGMVGYIPSPEEIKTVLFVMKVGASPFEKEVLDYLIEREEQRDEA